MHASTSCYQSESLVGEALLGYCFFFRQLFLWDLSCRIIGICISHLCSLSYGIQICIPHHLLRIADAESLLVPVIPRDDQLLLF